MAQGSGFDPERFGGISDLMGHPRFELLSLAKGLGFRGYVGSTMDQKMENYKKAGTRAGLERIIVF